MRNHLYGAFNLSRVHFWCSLHGISSLPYFCLCLVFNRSSSLFVSDPYLPFSPSSIPPFSPTALPFLPSHICQRRSVAGVALGFKFNLVSICCNCFERQPCLHVFPLLRLPEYWLGRGCVCVCMCVCVNPEQLPGHTLSMIHFVKHQLLSLDSLALWQCFCQTPYSFSL